MKPFILITILGFISAFALAQEAIKSVKMIGFPDKPDRWYTVSTMQGYSKFYKGYVITPQGVKMDGSVAVVNYFGDWNFVRRYAVFIPEGEKLGYYLGNGDAATVCQFQKKKTKIFDQYQGIFLERLVSGTVRVYYNPGAGTTTSIGEIVGPALMDSLRQEVAEGVLRHDLEEGKSFSESVENAQAATDLTSDIAGAIEITEKEYIIFKEANQETTMVKADSYSSFIYDLFDGCSAVEPKTVKSYSKKYKSILDIINSYNALCGH